MSISHDSSNGAPVNPAALAEISQGDKAVERRLLGVFRKSNETDAAALRVALAQRDMAAVIRAAHRVMGASKMAGAATLAAICGSIVQAGRDDDWSAVTANKDVFYCELDRVNAYLALRLDVES